jgi:hypothetical protein
MPQALNPVELLKLISNTEIESFAELLNCRLTTSNPREELAAAIQNHSRTQVVSALISVNGVWLTMMRDVIRFLEKCDASLRTTGFVLAIPINGDETRIHLSPQVADLIAHFDMKKFRSKTISDWDKALSTFKNLERWLMHTLQAGEPVRHRRFSDDKLIDSVVRGRPVHDLYENRIRVNALAAERMFSLWRTLDYLNDKLKPLGDLSSPPPAVKKLRNEVERISSSFNHRISRVRRDGELWRELARHVKQTDPWSPGLSDKEDLFRNKCWRHDTSWDKWIRLMEDVLSLANVEKSPELADLLQLDLLKDRPRLFEVWCMSQILSWYRSWGCAVELESIKSGNPPVWNLNYSRASVPVARIEYGGARWWLFFQLFKTGSDRANMPDIALLNGRAPSSGVVWIADPKYSEAEGYDRKDYVEVAERYRDAFEAQRVWICEFFARRHWFGGACHERGEGFSILTEVQPNGEGTRLLKRELRELHGFSASEFVLAIDCSGSFSDNLSKLEREITLLSERATFVICFAGTAKEIGPENVDMAMIQGASKSLGGDTRLGPLVSELESLPISDSLHTDLILVTDGLFSDSSNEMRAKLEQMFSKVEQVTGEASLTRIVSERC